MQGDRPKSAGIREIAETLSISIGTVDRALHARPGVSPKTLARVLKKAEELGYRPNVAARNLKLNRRLRIAVHLPKHIECFFDPLRAGIQAAAASSTSANIEIDYREYPRLNHGDIELLETALDARYDGIIITPGDPARTDAMLTRIARSGTAVVCVASDAPRSERIASISVDAYVSGAVAAELLARTIPAGGSVVAITGELTTLDHADKLRGFAATLATLAPHLSLLPTLESHERAKEAYRQTSALLTRRPSPVGMYISTANSVPVFAALREHRMLGKVRVVATDLFPALIPLLEKGNLLATLYQRPSTQAKVAFDTLMRYLVDGTNATPIVRLAPHIVLQSNLSLFMNRMSGMEKGDDGLGLP